MGFTMTEIINSLKEDGLNPSPNETFIQKIAEDEETEPSVIMNEETLKKTAQEEYEKGQLQAIGFYNQFMKMAIGTEVMPPDPDAIEEAAPGVRMDRGPIMDDEAAVAAAVAAVDQARAATMAGAGSVETKGGTPIIPAQKTNPVKGTQPTEYEMMKAQKGSGVAGKVAVASDNDAFNAVKSYFFGD